jgi:hypothetical protein
MDHQHRGRVAATDDLASSEAKAPFLPREAQDFTAAGRFARIGEERAGAAAQMQRTLRVWRKAQEEGAPAEGEAGPEAKPETKEEGAGAEEQGAEAEEGRQGEAAEVQEEAPAIGAKIFLAGGDRELLNWCKKVKMDANSETTQQLFANRAMSVQAYIGQFRKGQVNRRLPDEAANMTVEAALRAGEVAGIGVRKLLTDGREKFAK